MLVTAFTLGRVKMSQNFVLHYMVRFAVPHRVVDASENLDDGALQMLFRWMIDFCRQKDLQSPLYAYRYRFGTVNEIPNNESSHWLHAIHI